MEKKIIILTFFGCLFLNGTYAQLFENQNDAISPTSIGIIVYSNDPETVWNALRIANYSKNEGDTVSIFLLGKGVELDNMIKTDIDIKKQTDTYLNDGGIILGCGTCLKSRNNKKPQVCKFSSMKDLYQLIRKNKIVLTF